MVGITEKEEGAGNAYTLGPSSMYILQGEDEIRLTSASGSSSSQNSYLEFDVKSPDGIMPTITTTEFDNYVVDHAVYIGLQARGSKPITWTATGLPKGLTISENGAISGRPKQAGAFNVKITATNAAGSVTKSIPMRVSNSDDTKVEIKSIVIDFEETPKTPFVGGAPNNQTFKVISTEPAHAKSSVSVISYWSDESGTMLNALNTYQLGDYFLYIGLNSQNKIYTATENTKVYLGSTLLTNDLAKDFGSIYTGYLKFNTKLSNKPTNLSIEGTYTFNGKIQSPVIPGYDSSTMQLIGAARMDAGSYLVTVKPWYKWADGTKDEIELSWSINPFNITTAGVLEIKTGINKYTGTEQEVNIESVKATINGESYTLERGVDYALGGDCTTWTDIGLAGGTTSKGFVIKGIGNFTGLSGNQIWLISKGDPAPLNFTVEAPTTPGGKGAVIGTTAAMVYLKSGMAYELKCSEGRTELYPGTYIIGKNADKYYNAVSQVVVIPEYDSSGDVRVLGVSLD